MKIQKVTAVYFSPTGGTKSYVRALAGAFGADFSEIDLTPRSERGKEYSFNEIDLVLFGAPVYAGRLPELEGGIFQNLKGHNTPAVFNVSYGNREFEDALLEEREICESNGFFGIAAGAWIAPHTYSNKIAAGRPDNQDLACVREFAQEIEKIIGQTEKISEKLLVPGNRPYRDRGGMSFYPYGTSDCISCGACAAICPVGAIDRDDPKKTNTKLCIDCFACVKGCPVQAREAREEEAYAFLVNKLESSLLKRRKEPETFFIPNK